MHVSLVLKARKTGIQKETAVNHHSWESILLRGEFELGSSKSITLSGSSGGATFIGLGRPDGE